MHTLSFTTWWIHIASVLEWSLAMLLVANYGQRRQESEWTWLALAMAPALVSAFCACTWHFFDNAAALSWLVTLQAATTLLGNSTMALASWWIWRRSSSRP